MKEEKKNCWEHFSEQKIIKLKIENYKCSKIIIKISTVYIKALYAQCHAELKTFKLLMKNLM